MDMFKATMLIEGQCELVGVAKEDVTFDEIIEAWQFLVDTGVVWQLQGWYGRCAMDLISAGYVQRANRKELPVKKIPDKTFARIDNLRLAIVEKRNLAVELFNEHVQPLLEDCNVLRDELHTVLDDQCTEAETYFEEHSEKWQESDAGQNYASWKADLIDKRDAMENDFQTNIEDNDFLSDLDEALGEVETICQQPIE